MREKQITNSLKVVDRTNGDGFYFTVICKVLRKIANKKQLGLVGTLAFDGADSSGHVYLKLEENESADFWIKIYDILPFLNGLNSGETLNWTFYKDDEMINWGGMTMKFKEYREFMQNDYEKFKEYYDNLWK